MNANKDIPLIGIDRNPSSYEPLPNSHLEQNVKTEHLTCLECLSCCACCLTCCDLILTCIKCFR